MDLNKAQLIGHITQDIELKQTPNGQNVTSFGIATNRNWTTESGEKKELVEFSNIVLWGKVAEIADKYLKKGSKIYIEGRLQTRNWEDKDGKKMYRTEIIGENLIMLDSKKDGDYQGQDTSNYAKKPAAKVEDITVEDIPF